MNTAECKRAHKVATRMEFGNTGKRKTTKKDRRTDSMAPTESKRQDANKSPPISFSDPRLRTAQRATRAAIYRAQRSVNKPETERPTSTAKTGAKTTKRFTAVSASSLCDARLTSSQRIALRIVEIRAKNESDIAYQKALDRALNNQRSLNEGLNYIRDDAPIIIHFKDTALPLLASDTHYRNAFETNTTRGNQCAPSLTYQKYREEKESKLFRSFYDNVPPFERPKYGCLNITGDIKGVPAARNLYGPCFITLKPDVRHRSTFHHGNTETTSKTTELGTNNHFAHILDKFSESDFQRCS
jgi:Protein of unknown function (DUF3626)